MKGHVIFLALLAALAAFAMFVVVTGVISAGEKCRDAGGVYVHYNCVAPLAPTP